MYKTIPVISTNRFYKDNFRNRNKLFYKLELRNRFKANKDVNLFNFHRDYERMAYPSFRKWNFFEFQK